MTAEQAQAVYDQLGVTVKWYPPTDRIPKWHKSVAMKPRNNGVLRPSQRPIPGHVPTTEAAFRAKRKLVIAAVAVLDATPPVETPEPDAAQLSFLAA